MKSAAATSTVRSTSNLRVIPNAPVLNKQLVDEFRDKFGDIRRSTLAICARAWEVKANYTDASGSYTQKFKTWYSNYGVDSIFGSKPNFTKYANAGEAIEKVQKNWDAKADQLPTSMNALYEVSQLTDDELRLCLENTYTRSSVTSPKTEWTRPRKPKPLIHPQTIAATIRAWRKNWRHPKPVNTERRTLPFLKLFVHGSLYDFDQAGRKPTGATEFAEVQGVYDKMLSTLNEINADDFIRIEGNLDALKNGYEKRFARAVEASSKKKKGKKG